MSKLISVIIPMYNAEKYIEECIKKILNQTINNFEIVIVNDGSTDNSVEICNKYAELDNRIKVISISNSGVSNARNVGFRESIGDYILWIDADDMMKENMLELLYNNIENLKADISTCSVEKVDIFGNKENIYFSGQNTVFNQDDAIKSFCLSREINSGIWVKLFKRSLIENIKFDNKLKINEDRLFIFEALMQSKKIVYIDKPLYIYVKRENSATTKEFNDKWFDMKTVSNQIYNTIVNEKKELELFARYQLILNLYSLIIIMFDFNGGCSLYNKEYFQIVRDIKDTSLKNIWKYINKSTLINIYIIKIFEPLFRLIKKKQYKGR